MRRSPEDVCVQYAVAVAAVRQLTKVIGDRLNQCEIAAQACGELDAAVQSRPSIQAMLKPPDMEDCLTKHWQIAIGPAPNYREEPYLAYVDMCDACQLRCDRIAERKIARKRLGAAKRAVEAVGKRVAQWKAERQEA